MDLRANQIMSFGRKQNLQVVWDKLNEVTHVIGNPGG